MRVKRRETLTAQGSGRVAEPYREIVQPIHVATTYERGTDGSYPGGRVYSRADNPTYDAPEALIASLEGAHAALLFASGEAAAGAFFQALMPGAVLAPRNMYWALRKWLLDFAKPRVLGPFESWLLLRGIRTLHLRVACACSNAMAIAQRFERHPKLSHVLYPGLASNPGHAVAARQMSGGFGGMMSLRLKAGEEAAKAFTAKLRVFKRATSLGSVESLAEHRASVEGPGTPGPPDSRRLSIRF